MTWSLTDIYRFPVKSFGEEALESADLQAGRPFPGDRRFALAHGDAEAPSGWGHPNNFINQCHVPRMVQIKTALNEVTGELTASHPDLGELTVVPSTPEGSAMLCSWAAPLVDGTTRGTPVTVWQGGEIAFTDFAETHISLANRASLRALEQRVGKTLQDIRFRMNLWMDGPAAWSELDWVDREVEIGAARLRIVARDKRCNATNANPATGMRDTQIPALLHKDFGHMDFGLYAQVVQSGQVKRGDPVRLI